MVPAEFVAEAVAVLADTGSKTSDFRDEGIPIEVRKIVVHVVSLWAPRVDE
jgi:hypothetical protein